jgi:hypothetical protein
MSAPTLQVLVGFQTTVNFGTPFQLDNATYGLLDTGTLGGYQMVDLTSMVQSVSLTRGRNREMEQFNGGTAQLQIYDPTRLLDPLNTASIYYPFVAPRQPVQILAGGVIIYTGFVTDWDLDYGYTTNANVTTVACADAFTVLANQSMNAVTPSAESSSARVAYVLTRPEVAYQGPYSVGTGSSTLGAFPITEGTNVLTYLQNVATSEQGYLFIASNGTLTFTGRAAVLNPVSSIAFVDTGSGGIPYRTLMNQYGDELLYNYIQTRSPAYDTPPPGIAASTASNANSISLYQAQQLSKLDLLNSTVAETAALGNYLLGRYMDPVLRFTGVTVQLAALSAADQTTALSTDLTRIASVQKTYSVGTPASVTQTLIVSGIKHSITPGSHVVEYTFESTDQAGYFTLDSTLFGVLDANLLAF